jgi:hypothetical protein
MNLGLLRIGFAVVFLQLAVGLLVARATASAEWKERLSAESVDLAVVVFFALAAWNLARWWVGRRRPEPATRWPDRRPH